MSKTKFSRMLMVLGIAALPIPSLAVYPKVSIGYDYMLLLKSDGTVWAWGYNSSGSLGTGNSTQANTPVQVQNLNGVVDIAAGKSNGFSMALKADGTVWVWGNLSDARSGVMTSGGVFSNVPVEVNGLHNILTIEASWDGQTAFAADTEGKVWAWGNGTSGELGDGAGTQKKEVTSAIPNLNNVVQISSSESQVIALRSDGSSVGWGWRSNGDNLLVGASSSTYVPPTNMNVPGLTFLQGVSSNTAGLFMGIDANESVLTWGDTNSGLLTCHQNIGSASLSSLPQPYSPTGLNQIQQIAGGGVYVLFLDKNGTVLGCGKNEWGQLGDGTTVETTAWSGAPKYGPVAATGLPQDISHIAAGYNASAAIAANGDVYTWGRADEGRSGVLNNQSAQRNPIPVIVGINAGAKSTAPAVFAGSQNGPIGNFTLDIGLAVAPEHVGMQGEIYLAVLLPDGQLIFLDSSNNWQAYDPAKPIPFLSEGVLQAKTPIYFGSNLNLTGLEGTQVFLGYGLGSNTQANQDLLNNQRYGSAVTLQ